MSHIVIAGVKPYDGRYPFDLEGNQFTTREWGWVKRLSGYMPLTVEQGFEGGDPELFACFAVIALRRHGTIQNADVPAVYERLIDGPFGTAVTLEADETGEADADPPPTPDLSGNELSSGGESMTSSETSPAPPNGSGTPGSAISESPLTPWVS